VGFETTIPVFERAKMIHALDRTATVIGSEFHLPTVNRLEREFDHSTVSTAEVKDSYCLFKHGNSVLNSRCGVAGQPLLLVYNQLLYGRVHFVALLPAVTT
jgi:hypothetical protein